MVQCFVKLASFSSEREGGVFRREACIALLLCSFIYFIKTWKDCRLRSSLWLQFKPNHIAAGAAFLAARGLNMDLSNGGFGWWQDFQTTPAILDNVVRQMMELYG